MIKKTLESIVGAGILMSTNAIAGDGTVTLEWDPSDSNVEKYLIYLKLGNSEPMRFSASTNQINGECRKTIHYLEKNRVYVFWATAVDKDGIESLPSNYVSWVYGGVNLGSEENPNWVINAKTDNEPPIIRLDNISAMSDFNNNEHPKGTINNPYIASNGGIFVSGAVEDENHIKDFQINNLKKEDINYENNPFLGGRFQASLPSEGYGLREVVFSSSDWAGNRGIDKVYFYSFDPSKDTDGDGMKDNEEINLGRDPLKYDNIGSYIESYEGKPRASFYAPGKSNYSILMSDNPNKPLIDWSDINTEEIKYENNYSGERIGVYHEKDSNPIFSRFYAILNNLEYESLNNARAERQMKLDMDREYQRDNILMEQERNYDSEFNQ